MVLGNNRADIRNIEAADACERAATAGTYQKSRLRLREGRRVTAGSSVIESVPLCGRRLDPVAPGWSCTNQVQPAGGLWGNATKWCFQYNAGYGERENTRKQPDPSLPPKKQKKTDVFDPRG